MSWRPRRLAILLVGAAAVAAWVAYLYALTWHAYGSHSDSANAARAGHDLVTGNPLLRGWKLPADSYWSIDLPVFGVLSALFGLSPRVVHLAPLVIAAAAIGVSGWCIIGSDRPGGGGDDGCVRRPWPGHAPLLLGLVGPVLLLGLPHPFLVYILFQGPWHVGTALLCLTAIPLAGAPWRSWRWAAAAALLAAAVVGDPIALALGVAPVVGASALRALRTRRAADLGHTALSGVVPVVAAATVRLLLVAAGGFDVAATETSPLSNVVPNLRHIPRLLGALLGVGRLAGLSTAGSLRYGGVDQAAHAAGATLLGAAVLVSSGTVALGIVRASRRRPDRGHGVDSALLRRVWRDGGAQVRGRSGEEWLDTALVFGFWGSIAAYAVVAAPDTGFAGARYLPAALLFGVTLAGRRFRNLAAAPAVLRRIAVVVLAALLPLYLLSSLRLLGRPQQADPDAQLAATLTDRHLTVGYAPYWIAANTVLRSGGRLTIIPVESHDGRLRAFDFYADRAVLHRSPPPDGTTFVVYRADTGWGNVDLPSARGTFGEPAAVETFGPYTLLIYSGSTAPVSRILSRAASSRTGTPRDSALASLEPAFVPATT
ncbi:MAG: hypothetical protein QOI86_2524 [Actinomycetota bacterium]|nr:hypothetical protein [Actinomycetota bacterium]